MHKTDIEEIEKKNKIVDNAIVRLKQDFVGIDEQIDQIMNHIRTWYVYPKLQIRPIVVAIWGLTGTGKTDLLRKITTYLDIEQDLVYFNFAEINEMSSYDVESTIEDQLSNEKSNRVFVYDEFQYAATLDGHGEEKDNKNGLKPFWELLDTGIIHKRMDYRSSFYCMKILNYMNRISSKCDMVIQDGKWVNCADCISYFSEYEISQFAEVFNLDYPNKPKKKPYSVDKTNDGYMVESEDYEEDSSWSECHIRAAQFVIKDHVLEHIFELLSTISDESVDKFELRDRMLKMNYTELYMFISDFYNKTRKGYNLKFNDSIIFIVGNLDEAYNIAFNVNPDMSPDQFHKISKEINVVDIKKALQKRFRNEQIARMGNSHVIYPAFSSKSFKKIIELNLNQYAKSAHEMCGYTLNFEKSLKDVIYRESVFPTHGTRPIFSSIQEIVKTKLVNVVRKLYEDKIECKTVALNYLYRNNRLIVQALDNEKNKIGEYKFEVKLRLDNLRKASKDEEQALCALHESGHFVVYSKLTGLLPEKLVSKTTESETGGFLMPLYNNREVVSKDKLIMDIMVALGGYVTEKMFFGEEKMSCGAMSDLKKATTIASRMVREYGMGVHCGVTTYARNVPNDGSLPIVEDNQDHINKQIKVILEQCLADTEDIFKDKEWVKMLQNSALYLSEHSNMPKSKMQEIYDGVSDDRKVCQNDRFYRDRIRNLLG